VASCDVTHDHPNRFFVDVGLSEGPKTPHRADRVHRMRLHGYNSTYRVPCMPQTATERGSDRQSRHPSASTPPLRPIRLGTTAWTEFSIELPMTEHSLTVSQEHCQAHSPIYNPSRGVRLSERRVGGGISGPAVAHLERTGAMPRFEHPRTRMAEGTWKLGRSISTARHSVKRPTEMP